jgi:hypothetical protein
MFFYDVCYDKEQSTGAQKMMLQLPQEQVEIIAPVETILYSVMIYPNPAKEYVNFQWEILEELKDCNYKMFDLTGILVMRELS